MSSIAKKKLPCLNPDCPSMMELQVAYGPDEGAYTCPACGQRYIVKRVGEYKYQPEAD